MKDKLEINMYVRTKYGISQYKHYDTLNGKLLCIPVKDGSKGVFANIEDILKASHNIIDLIEVGDYVNGYPIYEIIEYEDNTRAIVIGDDNKSIIWEESSQYIESIVTKEQFSSMEYRLGGK